MMLILIINNKAAKNDKADVSSSRDPILSREIGDGGCRDLVYLKCHTNETFTGLVIKSLTILAPGLTDCQRECFLETKCVSYNLGPIQRETRRCELNAGDHWMLRAQLVPKQGYEYCPLKNPCSSGPCQGREICRPDFGWNSFSCSSDGMWSFWGSWQSCSCGDSHRNRTCLSGNGCSGNDYEKKQCRMGIEYPIVKTKEGKQCTFPFNYEGRCFDACTKYDWDLLWCSYDTEYSAGKWGYCV